MSFVALGSLVTKGGTFCDFVFASLADIALPHLGLLFKKRNFLQEKQIFSFESKSLLRRKANT